MNVMEFRTRDGQRLAIRPETVDAVLELENGGCQIITDGDTHVVDHPYPQVVGLIWPEIFE